MINKDLLRSYSEGDSVLLNNERLKNQQMLQNADMFMNRQSAEEAAYYYNEAPTDNELGVQFSDFWHKFYNDVQEAQIDDKNLKITRATMQQNDAALVMHYLYPETMSDEDFYKTYGIDRSQAKNLALSRLDALRQNGMWTEKSVPNLQELIDLLNDAESSKQLAIEDKAVSEQELQESLNNHDISQYFTKKSNELTTDWGNFLYKLPGLFGGSYGSWGHQLTSLASSVLGGAVAGTAIGAITGAGAGSAVAPGPGTLAGGAVGGVGGALAGAWSGFTAALPSLATASAAATAGYFGGGYQSRVEESNMEAYGRYEQNLSRIIEEDGIDTDKVINNVKKTLAKRGENSNITDEQALSMAYTGQVASGSNQFDDARRRAYRGIERLYERNMSLEAGDMAVDMLMYVPMFRSSSIFRGLVNPAEGATSVAAKAFNPIKSLLTKRRDANIDIARRALTGDALASITKKQALKEWGAAQLANMYEEATEEGAQYIMSDKAAKGEFDDDAASGSFWNAVKNGLLVDDVVSNWIDRQRSSLAVFTPFDPVYSNDDELKENYLSGAILSSIDPRTVTFGAIDYLKNTSKQIKNDKRFGDIFQRALEEQDFVDRSVDLLQAMRDLKANGRNYDLVLNHIADALKTKKFDLGAISDKGNDTTDEEIDSFIEEERKNVATLLDTQKQLSDKASKLGLSERDSDIYFALANNIRVNIGEQDEKTKLSKLSFLKKLREVTADDTLFDTTLQRQIDDVLSKNGESLDESQRNSVVELVTNLLLLRKQIEYLKKRAQTVANQAYGQKLLKENGITNAVNSTDNANQWNAVYLMIENLQRRLRLVETDLVMQLQSYSNFEKLDNELSELEDYLKNAKESEEGFYKTEEGKLYSIPYLQNKIKKQEEKIASAKKAGEDTINELRSVNPNDAELNSALEDYLSNEIDNEMLASIAHPFFTGNKSIKTNIENYKKRVRQQAAQRDEANQSVSESTETAEQVKKRTDEELETQLNDSVNNILSSLQNVASNEQLGKLINRLSVGINTISSAIGKVQYVARSLDKFTKNLEKIKENLTEEDRKIYSELKQVIDSANNLAKEINKRSSDRAFNSKKQSLKIQIDTNEWMSPDGKKFKFLPKTAQFSVNDGGSVSAIDVTDMSDVDQLRSKLKEQKEISKSIIKKLGNELLNDSDRQELNKQLQQIGQIISSIEQDINNALLQKQVEFNFNKDSEYLSKFYRVNNKNEKISFALRLKNIKAIVDKAISAAIEDRDNAKEDDNTEEVPDSDSGAEELSPDYLEKEDIEKQKEKKKLKCLAYPFLGSANGKMVANRFTMPYYRALHWRGYVTVQKWEDAKEYDFANKKSEKGSKLKWDRPAAYATYEKLLRATKNKSKEQILELIDKIKKGNYSAISKTAYQNMVKALPMNAVMFNSRIKTSNGVLIPHHLAMPDETSANRQNELSELEFGLRENIILNLAEYHSRNNDKQPVVNIKEGSVNIYMKSFMQHTRTISDPNVSALYSEDGKLASRKQINDIYDNHLQKHNVKSRVINELLEILSAAGYNTKNIPETVNVGDSDYNSLDYLLRGLAEYGDSVINQDTFVNNYIKTVFGLSSAAKRKGDKTKLVESLLNSAMNNYPNMFLNFDKKGGEALNTMLLVEDALLNHYSIRMNIKHNGQQLVLNSRTKDTVVDLCDMIEAAIQNLDSAELFIIELQNLGFSFDSKAKKTLKEYFINRKFNKLLNPSNIINVLTSDKSVPVGNTLINTTKKEIINSGINEVLALGIVFDETTGKYFYTQDTYKRYIENMVDQEEEDADEDLLTAEQQQVEEAKNNALSVLNGRGKLNNKINTILEAYSTDYDTVITAYNEANPKDKKKNKRLSKQVIEWFINKQAEKQLQELYEKFSEQNDSDLESEIDDLFDGKTKEPVVLAYATANGTIMRFDTYTRKLEPVKNAKGSPGNVYLLLPSFFSSNARRVLVKLNPSKIDKSIARVVADLMLKVASGEISENSMIDNSLHKNLKVTQQITVGQFIRTFMFYGTDAIERNPSNFNLDRLVYIKDGSVYFGNTIDGKGTKVTSENIEEFINWISTIKNYRIDKDKLASDSGVVEGSFSITDDSGNIVYEQEHGDNYVTLVIKNKFIQTDMDTSKDSRIFAGNPHVYFEINDRFEGVSVNEKESKNTKTTSATAAKEKAKSAIKEMAEKANKSEVANFIAEVRELMLDELKNFSDVESIYFIIDGVKAKKDLDFTVDSNGNISFANSTKKITEPLQDAFNAGKTNISIEVTTEDGETSVIKLYEQQLPNTQLEPKKEIKPQSVPKAIDDTTTVVITEDDEDKDITNKLKTFYRNNKDVIKKKEKEFIDTWLEYLLNVDGDVKITRLNPLPSDDAVVDNTVDNTSSDLPGTGITSAVIEKTPSLDSLLGPSIAMASKPQPKTTTTTSKVLTDEDYIELKDENGQAIVEEFVKGIKNYDSLSVEEKKLQLVRIYMSKIETLRSSKPLEYLKILTQFREKVGEWALSYDQSKKPLLKAVSSFLRMFVRMEDATTAINKAKRILGEDFNFEIDSQLPFEYDSARHALVYVYGVCTSNGIRLFRDAKKNKIKRGVAYHEAFHRVSMLLLTKVQRERMYNALRQANPSFKNASERDMQEYLADKFAQFVLRQISMENPVYRFFDKIRTKINNLINRLYSTTKRKGIESLNSLFNDMYAGKYAYAKVSKENKEYFDLTFGYDPLYSGYKYDGIEMASSQLEFNDIYRNILASIIKSSGITSNQYGITEINYDEVKKYWQSEKEAADQAVNTILSDPDATPEDILNACSFLQVTNGIITNWKHWVKYMKKSVRLNFSLDLVTDPNDLDYSSILNDTEDTIEIPDVKTPDGGITKTILNHDNIVQSFMRNLFKTLDADIRLFLYTIYDDSQLTDCGLTKYVNVYQLWHDMCHACQQAKDVDDMIRIFEDIAKSESRNNQPLIMRQVANILKDETTTEQLKNRLFGNIVKYINDFIFINYRTNKQGKIEAQIEDSNLTKRMLSTRNVWTQSIKTFFSGVTNNLYNTDEKDRIKWYLSNVASHLQLTSLNKLTGENLSKILQLFNIEIDSDKIDKLLEKYDSKEKLKLMRNYNVFLQNIRTSIFNTINNKELTDGKTSVESLITDLFNPNKDPNIISVIAEQLGEKGFGSAKNDTVRIAGGATAYIIGQYNHVTRFFKRLLYDKDFMNSFKQNPYTKWFMDGSKVKYQGSKWLNQILDKGIYPSLLTPVGTVSDSNYNTSNDFMGITDIEDMLNRFTTSLSNNHNIPELANRKTQYIITNLLMEACPISVMGPSRSFIFTDTAINTFKGYLRAEIEAIREANRVRDEFVKAVNANANDGKKHTAESISKMSQKELEELFKRPNIAPLLVKLKKTYHYSGKSGKPLKQDDGSFRTRTFGIDLVSKKNNGYKSRHFGSILDGFKITASTTDTEINQWLNRSEVADGIKSMLQWNIKQTLDFMNRKGIISGYDSEKGLNGQDITNLLLPENLILSNKNINSDGAKQLTTSHIMRAISFFVMNMMCDVIEFEKLVAGDVAQYKDIDAVNKRYSAQTSTVAMKNTKGTIINEFTEDRLYDATEYNVLELNTTPVDDINKFKHEAKIFLGVDAFDESLNVGDTLSGDTKFNCLDYKKLLNEKGEFTKEAKQGELVKRYLQHRDEGRSYGVDDKGNRLTDEQLAKRITDNAYVRLIKYRTIDPTDAQAWSSAEFDRQLKQRQGEWTQKEEAAYNLLEHYDELEVLQRNENAYNRLLNTLNIDKNSLEQSYKLFKEGNISKREYAGSILAATNNLSCGSLKYVFFGNGDMVSGKEVFKVYDKLSASPIYKIFADFHDMRDVYDLMKETKTDFIKMESCTKTGNIPSFELYDKDGKIDKEAFRNAPKQKLKFENFGKQLNTDPHEHNVSAILTQFMKVAVLNIDRNFNYVLNGVKVSGTQLLEAYLNILDKLTVRGYNSFCKKFGVDPNTFDIDKEKFMNTLQDMASTQGASPELMDALTAIDNDFVIHPSALPNINWVQSRVVALMEKTIIKTMVPGKPLFQVASAGYDNILNTPGAISADTKLKSYNDDGFMEVKLSINLFSDVLKQAGLQNVPFNVQKKFLLDNQDVLFALSYRVPTQGQNSTIPIKTVDLFESLRGDIISFPADITALTGSDFD